MNGYLSISVPDEICIEILERLSVKSLVRFKATRKSWKSLITDPSFVDHHLNRSATRCRKLAIFEDLWGKTENSSKSRSVVHLLDLGNPAKDQAKEAIHRKICCRSLNSMVNDICNLVVTVWRRTNRIANSEKPDPSDQTTVMEFPSTVPSCVFFRCCTFRGLMMVGSDSADNEFSLCNPCTRQSWNIPNPPNCKFLNAAALGYDFIVKTHKVVIIRQIYFAHSQYEIAVYNVKTNSWTTFTVDIKDDDPTLDFWTYSLTLANGAPHWMRKSISQRIYQIACFDFSKNELIRIPIPNTNNDYVTYHDPHLFEMEGRLCIAFFRLRIGFFSDYKVEIWVMMEHGLGESWTRLALSRDEIPACFYFHRPISFAKDGMVSLVLELEENTIGVYIGKKRRTEIKIDEKQVKCNSALMAEALAFKHAVNENRSKETQWRIRPIREALSSIPSKEIVHVKRGANLAAHWFARKGRKGMSCADFQQHPPSSLSGIWSKDGVPAPP
ncbi:hypothetical protein COLO4_15955 [Corchorus olitorius]|uniref:F-box domain-containing protein n=1 Tax=Corchorus olitorius TaxID=93759 RepID=A0A1R3JKM8_9ROSI|nr:hypothetical protein COLO4_15955 [Corchorus olitorius]